MLQSSAFADANGVIRLAEPVGALSKFYRFR
jgi:hypothetical protein